MFEGVCRSSEQPYFLIWQFTERQLTSTQSPVTRLEFYVDGCRRINLPDTARCLRNPSYTLRLMYIPLFSESRPRLERRKGGGGGKSSGGGGKGSSSKSSSGSGGGKSSGGGGEGSGSEGGKGGSSKSSGGSGGGKKSNVPLPSGGSSHGKSSATTYGYGGGKPIVIPAGQPFAGRSAGGATRSQIFGTKTYGSGYPGIGGRGVLGRPFPFWFWPVV